MTYQAVSFDYEATILAYYNARDPERIAAFVTPAVHYFPARRHLPRREASDGVRQRRRDRRRLQLVIGERTAGGGRRAGASGRGGNATRARAPRTGRTRSTSAAPPR